VDCELRDRLAALLGGNTDVTPPVIVFATDNATTDAVTGEPVIVTLGDGVITVDYGVPVTEYYFLPATAAAAADAGDWSRIRFARAWDEKAAT